MLIKCAEVTDIKKNSVCTATYFNVLKVMKIFIHFDRSYLDMWLEIDTRVNSLIDDWKLDGAENWSSP